MADGFRAQLTPHDARVLHRHGRDFVHVAMDEDADNAAADDNASSNASKGHKRLLDQAVSRAAKRLATVCQNKARKPNDLLNWCDSKAVDHQSIVNDELEVSLGCVVSEQKASLLMLASQQRQQQHYF